MTRDGNMVESRISTAQGNDCPRSRLLSSGKMPSAHVLFVAGVALPGGCREAAGSWIMYRRGPIHCEACCGSQTTITGAALEGLLAGLEAALVMGIEHIEVYTDCERLIEIMNGQRQCRNRRIQELRDEARVILARFRTYSLDWITPKMNEDTILLARTAASEQRDIAGLDYLWQTC